MPTSLLEKLFADPAHSQRKIADAVLKLSDFYIENPTSPTPWSEAFCKIAYRHYFLPLNFVRNQLVVRRGRDVDFFADLDHVVDWGCGPGTASLALSEIDQMKSYLLIDRAPELKREYSDLWSQHLQNNFEFDSSFEIHPDRTDRSRSLLVCSYSLTEKNSLPKGWDSFEALMILEPSTQEDGRRLLHLREQLIKNGYVIWAPCLHQDACPLLADSKRDWCHDRAHVHAPKWFQNLESELPMRNRTVTTSYLLARKDANLIRSQQDDARQSGKLRLIGDQLHEKGKTRQMVCRSSKREFLTWLHKETTPPELSRGDFYQLPQNPEDYTLLSNEIRIKK